MSRDDFLSGNAFNQLPECPHCTRMEMCLRFFQRDDWIAFVPRLKKRIEKSQHGETLCAPPMSSDRNFGPSASIQANLCFGEHIKKPTGNGVNPKPSRPLQSSTPHP